MPVLRGDDSGRCGGLSLLRTRADDTSGAVAATPAPVRKKRPALLWFVLITLVVCGVPAYLIWPRSTPTQQQFFGAPAGGTTYRVTYRVSGTATGASLTYQNASGDTEQKDVALPWDMSFDGRAGQFVYMSAQNKGAFGTVVCEILLNGTQVKTSTSEGAYKIASCSGRL